MQLVIDEQEQGHVYTCLLVAGEKFGKAKKDLEKLDMDVAAIEEQLGINAKLKRIFNPRAEEEARAKDRAKTDPAQIDLTDVGSSGETGGGIPAGQTFKLHTGAELTDEELRDALIELGMAVMLQDVVSWSDDEAHAAREFVDAARSALANQEPVPDYPECVYRDGTAVARLAELLAAGPYRAEPSANEDQALAEWNVGRDGVVDGVESFIVDDIYGDKLDAELRAARLNRTELQRADMTDDEILEWGAKGPWGAGARVDGEDGEVHDWYIVAGTQREACESELEAMGRAARYNRSIAQRPASEPDYEIVEEHADIGEKEVPVEVGRAD